jgi:hypothetical protein
MCWRAGAANAWPCCRRKVWEATHPEDRERVQFTWTEGALRAPRVRRGSTAIARRPLTLAAMVWSSGALHCTWLSPLPRRGP